MQGGDTLSRGDQDALIWDVFHHYASTVKPHEYQQGQSVRHMNGRDFFKLVRDMDLFDGRTLRPDNAGEIFCRFVSPQENLMDSYELHSALTYISEHILQQSLAHVLNVAAKPLVAAFPSAPARASLPRAAAIVDAEQRFSGDKMTSVVAPSIPPLRVLYYAFCVSNDRELGRVMYLRNFVSFATKADLSPGLLSTKDIEDAVYTTVPSDKITFDNFIKLLAHCAHIALNKFPYSSKYPTSAQQLEALMARIAFSDATVQVESDLAADERLPEAKIIQNWWAHIRAQVFDAERGELVTAAETPRELTVPLGNKFGISEQDSRDLERVFDIVCRGIEPTAGVNKPEAWLNLPDFFRVLRGSALLSNRLAFKEAAQMFNSAQGLHGPVEPFQPRELSLEQFVLLFSSVALCNSPQKPNTPLVTGGEYVHQQVSEVGLLTELLHNHLFPSVLEVRSVVGDDDKLEELMVPEVLQLLGTVQPALMRVFCHYAGCERADEATALPLRKLEAFARDFLLFPQVVSPKDVQVAFSATGTKRRRRFPHFVEWIARVSVMAFQHAPLNQQESRPRDAPPIGVCDKLCAVMLYLARASEVNGIFPATFRQATSTLHSDVWTPPIEEKFYEQEEITDLELYQEEIHKLMERLRRLMHDQHGTLHSTFMAFDRDHSTEIDMEEFLEMCERLPATPGELPLHKNEASNVYYAIDTDNNGTISFAELRTALQLGPMPEVKHEEEDEEEYEPIVLNKPRLLKGQFSSPTRGAEGEGVEEAEAPDAAGVEGDPLAVQMYEDQIEELRLVFDRYATHGFRSHGVQTKMRLSQFTKLLRDTDLLPEGHEAETKLVFVEAATLAASVQGEVAPDGHKHGDNKQLGFDAFCFALSRIAERIYGEDAGGTATVEHMDTLLTAHIFPLAHLKPSQQGHTSAAFNAGCPKDGHVKLGKHQLIALRVSAWKGQPQAKATLRSLGERDEYVFQVAEVLKKVEPALKVIFDYYATQASNASSSAVKESDWKWVDRRNHTLDITKFLRIMKDFGILGRMESEHHLSDAFRMCCQGGHADKKDKTSYAGDDHQDVMSFHAFQEVLYRIALAVYHKDDSTSPPQKLDTLLYVIASSEARSKLQRKLHGQARGHALHAMMDHTLTTISGFSNDAQEMEDRDEEPDEDDEDEPPPPLLTHTVDVDPLEAPANANMLLDLLESDQDRMLRQVFSFYASFGQPLNNTVINGGKVQKLCRECGLSATLNSAEVDLVFRQFQTSSSPAPAQRGSPKKPNGLDFDKWILLMHKLGMMHFQTRRPDQSFLALVDEMLQPLQARAMASNTLGLVAGISTELRAEVAPVVSKMQKRLKQYFSLYCPKAGQRTVRAAGAMPSKNVLQFSREFDLVPKLCSQREISAALQESPPKVIDGEEIGHSFMQFIDILISVAETGYAKFPHKTKYHNPLERMTALLLHLEMSAGRKKNHLKMDPWASTQMDALGASVTKKKGPRF